MLPSADTVEENHMERTCANALTNMQFKSSWHDTDEQTQNFLSGLSTDVWLAGSPVLFVKSGLK